VLLTLVGVGTNRGRTKQDSFAAACGIPNRKPPIGCRALIPRTHEESLGQQSYGPATFEPFLPFAFL
jgi:hypothetical protein